MLSHLPAGERRRLVEAMHAIERPVASIAATFVQRYDPKRERCWIAEKDGEIVGEERPGRPTAPSAP